MPQITYKKDYVLEKPNRPWNKRLSIKSLKYFIKILYNNIIYILIFGGNKLYEDSTFDINE